MKVWRIRDKSTKLYFEENLDYACPWDRLYVNKKGHYYKNLERLKKLVAKFNDYNSNQEGPDREGDFIIYPSFKGRFEIVEGQLKDCDKNDNDCFSYRIKDTLSNKYYAGGKKFDDKGRVYNSRGGAEVALSKKSKSKKAQRGTKAGAVLFMDKDFANCIVVGVTIQNTKVIR
jgi:hypothetical protein